MNKGSYQKLFALQGVCQRSQICITKGRAVVDRNGKTGTGFDAAGQTPFLQPVETTVTFLCLSLRIEQNTMVTAGLCADAASDTVRIVQLNGAGGCVESKAMLGADIHTFVCGAMDAGDGVPGQMRIAAPVFFKAGDAPQRRHGIDIIIVFIHAGGYTGIAADTIFGMEIKTNSLYFRISHTARPSFASALRIRQRTLR